MAPAKDKFTCGLCKTRTDAAASGSAQHLGARGYLPKRESVLQFLKEGAAIAVEEFKDYP
jgi:hypothetical protein